MQKIGEYTHGDITYTFEPPIELDDNVKIESLGQLAGCAIRAASSHLLPGAARVLGDSVAGVVNSQLKDSPQLVIFTLQSTLRDMHHVRASRVSG